MIGRHELRRGSSLGREGCERVERRAKSCPENSAQLLVYEPPEPRASLKNYAATRETPGSEREFQINDIDLRGREVLVSKLLFPPSANATTRLT